MIPASIVFAFLSKFGKSIMSFFKESWPFVKKNWKNILLVGFLIWVIVCCLSHCRYVSPWDEHTGRIDTVSLKVDTQYVYADTNAIFALHGFDTIPKYIERLEKRLRFRPPTTDIHGAVDCRDSITRYQANLAECVETVSLCDSAYEDAVAVRTYNDKLKTDSIEVSLEVKVNGTLYSAPKLSYRYLAPYPVVTKTVVLKETPEQRRKIFLGAAIGPRLPWKSDRLDAIVGSAEAGFTDRKDNSFGLQGDFSQKGYTVKFAYGKSFVVGK